MCPVKRRRSRECYNACARRPLYMYIPPSFLFGTATFLFGTGKRARRSSAPSARARAAADFSRNMKLGLQRSDPAVLLYRCFVVAYAVILPIYFHYRVCALHCANGLCTWFLPVVDVLARALWCVQCAAAWFHPLRVPVASATPRPPQLPEHVFWAQPGGRGGGAS